MMIWWTTKFSRVLVGINKLARLFWCVGMNLAGRAVLIIVQTNLLLLPGNGSYPIGALCCVPTHDTHADRLCTDVHFQPQGSAVSAGQALLENYLQGVTSATTIQGSQGSTAIDSLKVAISDLRLTPVEIPALHQNLITSAALELPTNIAQTGIAYASFAVDNPFTASINILEVTSIVTYEQLTIGKIDHADLTSSPVHANGHSNITSPQLPFKFNLDPLTIVQLLLSGSQTNHVDLGPLVELLKIVTQNPNYHPPVRRDWIGTQYVG